MGPFRCANELLTITVNPHQITCACIVPARSSSLDYPSLTLRAFESFSFDQNELHHTLVYNPSHIHKTLQPFITKNRLHHARVAWALRGPAVHEALIFLHTPTPARSDFKVIPGIHWLWHHQYVCTHDDNQFMFYLAGMQRQHIVQYHALTRLLQLRPARITTTSMSLLRLSRFLYGNTFRSSALRQRLMDKGNNIDALYDAHMLARILTIGADSMIHHYQEHTLALLTACALVISEADDEEY